MATDTLLHALTSLHHTLTTKWLLRSFRARGAPPTSSDMSLAVRLADAVETLRERGLEDVQEIIELLETIAAALPGDIRDGARACLVMVREEEWVSVGPGGTDSNDTLLIM